MNSVTMNSLVLAKKLRVRRVELRKAHSRAVAAYGNAFSRWRLALGGWLIHNARKRVATITRADLTYRYGDGYQKRILDGAPKPPKKPDDSVIRKIDATLRRLAITGQKTVQLSDRDLDELFVDSAGDDE